MNEHKLKRLFPKASDAFIQANSDKDTKEDGKLESNTINEPLAETQPKKGVPERLSVVVESRRHRELDKYNLFDKFWVDCLRYAGIIPGDSPKEIEHYLFQTIIPKTEKEEIVITIEPISVSVKQ